MPCDTKIRPGQTFTQRKTEVREAIAKLSSALVTGRAKAVVGPTGGVAFTGWDDRANVTDNCAYRLILATGSALAKQAIARAEQIAGRTVSRQAVAQGHHAHEHDGHLHWHDHKG
jgi:hypothetical protein